MKKRVISLLCVFFWLVVWQAGAMALNQRILLVTPVDAAVKLIELIPSADFWKSVMFSAGRILSGFALGLTVGTGLAVFSGRYVFLRKLISPFISVLKAVPVASFTILALMWVSS